MFSSVAQVSLCLLWNVVGKEEEAYVTYLPLVMYCSHSVISWNCLYEGSPEKQKTVKDRDRDREVKTERYTGVGQSRLIIINNSMINTEIIQK